MQRNFPPVAIITGHRSISPCPDHRATSLSSPIHCTTSQQVLSLSLPAHCATTPASSFPVVASPSHDDASNFVLAISLLLRPLRALPCHHLFFCILFSQAPHPHLHHCAATSIFVVVPLRTSSSLCCHVHLHCCVVTLIFIVALPCSSSFLCRRAHLYFYIVALIFIAAPLHSAPSSRCRAHFKHCHAVVIASSAHCCIIAVARTVSCRCAIGQCAPLSSTEPPSGALTEPHHLPLFDCCLLFFILQPTGLLSILRPMGLLSIL